MPSGFPVAKIWHGVFTGLFGRTHPFLDRSLPVINPKLDPMSIESIPKFTATAAALWATIPADTKKELLSNVWCGKCRHEVTISNFTGAVKGGDLLLVGLCSECHGDVARLIEVN